MNQTVLNYLTKVLGIGEILSADRISEKTVAATPVCCVPSEPMNPEETALFWKMMAAMRLSPDEVLLSERLEGVQTGIFILMDMQTEGAGAWNQVGGLTVLRTFHPRLLVQKPELKRDAWEHLKEVMRRLAGE